MPDTMIRGSDLSPARQRDALACYLHRYTGDHKPMWAKRERRPDGSEYPVQFASDREWLENTLFPVTKRGTLTRRDCQSTPTWPLGTPVEVAA